MKKSKHIILSLALICILLFSLCIAIIYKSGYYYNILHKLGLSEKYMVCSDIVSSSTEQSTITLEQLTAQVSVDIGSWNNCIEKLRYDADVVFFGDSLTRWSDFQATFTDLKICNLGYSGDHLTEMLDRSSVIKTLTPEKIFIQGGINGFKENGVDNTIKTYKELIHIIKSDNPNAEIYVQSLMPISKEKESLCGTNEDIQKCNQELQKVCKDFQVIYIDLYRIFEKNGYINEEYSSDGIHLYPEYYHLWENQLRQFLY